MLEGRTATKNTDRSTNNWAGRFEILHKMVWHYSPFIIMWGNCSCCKYSLGKDKEFNESRKVLNGKATKLWKQWSWVRCGLAFSTCRTATQISQQCHDAQHLQFQSVQLQHLYCILWHHTSKQYIYTVSSTCCDFKELASCLHNIDCDEDSLVFTHLKGCYLCNFVYNM